MKRSYQEEGKKKNPNGRKNHVKAHPPYMQLCFIFNTFLEYPYAV